ncbi:hypothetical protein V8C86DRAFT_2768173 [Haematococcus lacustris]
MRCALLPQSAGVFSKPKPSTFVCRVPTTCYHLKRLGQISHAQGWLGQPNPRNESDMRAAETKTKPCGDEDVRMQPSLPPVLRLMFCAVVGFAVGYFGPALWHQAALGPAPVVLATACQPLPAPQPQVCPHAAQPSGTFESLTLAVEAKPVHPAQPLDSPETQPSVSGPAAALDPAASGADLAATLAISQVVPADPTIAPDQ